MARTVRAALDIGASVITVVAGVVFLWLVLRPAKTTEGIRLPRGPVELVNPRSGEDIETEVVAVQFADFECPYSAQMAREALPTLRKEYVTAKRVHWVFRHLPLPQHKQAFGAAVAVECAAKQDRFWPMHDAVFAEREALTPERLFAIADEIAVDKAAFANCVRDPATAAAVQEDVRVARQMRITNTPTVLLGVRAPGGRVEYVDSVEGAAPIEVFRAAFDKAIRRDRVSYWTWLLIALGGVMVTGGAWFLRRGRMSRADIVVQHGRPD